MYTQYIFLQDYSAGFVKYVFVHFYFRKGVQALFMIN